MDLISLLLEVGGGDQSHGGTMEGGVGWGRVCAAPSLVLAELVPLSVGHPQLVHQNPQDAQEEDQVHLQPASHRDTVTCSYIIFFFLIEVFSSL